MPPKLSFVVPCYNEQEALPVTARRLAALLQELVARGRVAPGSNVWFVDDGSTDGTWPLIERLARESPAFEGLKLSRNCGHQRALLAGLLAADGDLVVSMDADLQDDPTVVEQMLAEAAAGSEIVYGVRSNRTSDTAFKRVTARCFYGLLRRMGVQIIPDHADYRLMGRRAIDALATYSESNLFLRGLIPQLGFPSSRVYYQRQARAAGVSKYPTRRMFEFAMEGVTSFSATPLRYIAMLGAFVFVASIVAAIWILVVRFTSDRAAPGWASTTLPIYALGGLQLLALGIVGEYVGRIYVESKRRPRFHVERSTRDPPLDRRPERRREYQRQQ